MVFIAVVLLLIAMKPLLIVLPLLLTTFTLLLTASPLLLTVVGVVEIPLVALSRCRVALTESLLTKRQKAIQQKKQDENYED